jgi:hypothetical protein
MLEARMRQTLRCHPDFPSLAATHIDVDVTQPRAGSLLLCYVVAGKIGDLRIPPVASPQRTDELWQSTCFEAFLRTANGVYYEFNFAPSTRWAAYRFTGYRSGMLAAGMNAPHIEVETSPKQFTLRASLELDRVLGLPRDAIWRLGLSAMIEDASGGKSYWALAHPPGKPDFHHSDCFAYELSPA